MKNKKTQKKHINHNPIVESTKAVFGEPKARENDEFTPKIFK